MITWRLPELVVLFDIFAFTQNPLTGINIYADMLQITYRFAIPGIQMPENHEKTVCVVNTSQQPLKKEARPGDDRAFEFTESNT